MAETLVTPGPVAMGNLIARMTTRRSLEKHIVGRLRERGRERMPGQGVSSQRWAELVQGAQKKKLHEIVACQSLEARVCVAYTSVLAKSVGPALWPRENQILRETHNVTGNNTTVKLIFLFYLAREIFCLFLLLT